MTVDISKLQFYSGYPIDKIVQSDTVTYTVPSTTPASSPPYPSSLQTIPNTYGQKALIIASWSIDGINFNSSLATLNYFSATFVTVLPKAFVNCGVDSTSIYFYIVNNFTTSLTFTIQYAIYSIS